MRAVDADLTGEAEDWTAAVAGLEARTVHPGQREPVDGIPSWISISVTRGGYPTGALANGRAYVSVSGDEYLAGDEAELETRVPASIVGRTPRERVNGHFSQVAGQRELLDALADDRVRLEAPEEGALLVHAWLVAAGHVDAAARLLGALRPLMFRVRFYPRFEARGFPRWRDGRLQRAALESIISRLEWRTHEPERHYDTTGPAFDRLVALWLTTVEGPPPSARREADGSLSRDAAGQPLVEGGWPCRRWPADWVEQRKRALAEIHRPLWGTSFAALHEILVACPEDARALSKATVAHLRQRLAGTITRHGLPGSPQRSELRRRQAESGRHTRADVAQVLVDRLGRLVTSDGTPDLDALVRHVEAGESSRVPAGTKIPKRWLNDAARAVPLSLHELVERRLIRSPEDLARSLPLVVGPIRSSALADPLARRMLADLYVAFRRRRSCMLSELQPAVRFEELPWVAALDSVAQSSVESRRVARDTLDDLVRLVCRAFPHLPLPQDLLVELKALSDQAGLHLPLVPTLAADTFTGAFRANWSDAARATYEVVGERLYGRYFGLTEPNPVVQSVRGVPVATWLGAECERRAIATGVSPGGLSFARAVLEQAEISTAQNLGALVRVLGLEAWLRERGETLATAALGWPLRGGRRLRRNRRDPTERLFEAAQGWRQGVFFLSFLEPERQRTLVAELVDLLRRAPVERRAFFERAVAGLAHVVDGGSFDAAGNGPMAVWRFVGALPGTPRP